MTTRTEDLRVQLGRSEIEKKYQTRSIWPARFAAARAARAAGWKPKEPELLVILTRDGPVTTPDILRSVAALESTPEVHSASRSSASATETMDLVDPSATAAAPAPDEIRFCRVRGYAMLKLFEETAHKCHLITVAMPDESDSRRRMALVIQKV